MIAIRAEDFDELLRLVSVYGMAGVVEALGQAAAANAHLALNRQDVEGGEEWIRTAQVLDKAASKLAT